MTSTTTSKRKKAVAATVTAAAILLAGTFAWTSISQQAKNEAIVDINPGGRLHDDFNGSNKDVYVENFNDDDDATAVPIYARIRLDQYMEIGPDAGVNVETGTTGRNVEAILGTDSYDKSTWVTYIPEGDIQDGTVQAHTHWQWELGNDENNKPYYMPTFDMNKDSLAADVNGTYEGTVEGDIVHYDDYMTYTETSEETGTEVVDWDSDTLDEDGGILSHDYNNGGVTTDENAPIDDADVLHRENESHTAEQITSTATVLTMDQWIAMDRPVGPYWVYDKDGWAYWAQEIAPGTTTGLFLDGINMNKTPDENWYYGINVVAQFVTAGDISAFARDGESITDEALELMGIISDMGLLVVEGADGLVAGTTASYTATAKVADVALTEPPADITYSLGEVNWAGEPPADADSAVTVTEDGVLTVASSVAAGTKITINAAAGSYTGSKTVKVEAGEVAATSYALYTLEELEAELGEIDGGWAQNTVALTLNGKPAGDYEFIFTAEDGTTYTDTATVTTADSEDITWYIGFGGTEDESVYGEQAPATTLTSTNPDWTAGLPFGTYAVTVKVDGNVFAETTVDVEEPVRNVILSSNPERQYILYDEELVLPVETNLDWSDISVTVNGLSEGQYTLDADTEGEIKLKIPSVPQTGDVVAEGTIFSVDIVGEDNTASLKMIVVTEAEEHDDFEFGGYKYEDDRFSSTDDIFALYEIVYEPWMSEKGIGLIVVAESASCFDSSGNFTRAVGAYVVEHQVPQNFILSGNTSAGTYVKDGRLYIGADETAKTLFLRYIAPAIYIGDSYIGTFDQPLDITLVK